MKCREKFIKFLAVLVIGLGAISLGLTGMNNAVNPNNAQFVSETRSVKNGHSLPQEVWGTVSDNQSSEPIIYVFRILFILFIISPPLIVLMLVLIWKELRDRNKLK
ncbi:MAG TPA: hypothetical protein VNB22_15645 [Pyrinomonadaceae bacterium]|nr:hypothetical protein [Pyrinomonadaceae bacterium]